MAVIVPTITAANSHVYREQMERIQSFAPRVHIDLMDGLFAPTKSVETSQIWWPEGMRADVHLMYQNPPEELKELIRLKPKLVVIPAESDCDIVDFASQLNAAGIDCGIALLANTTVDSVKDIVPHLQHALVFSGNLGYQGGSFANLELLKKVDELKALNSQLEIGWDGGVNAENTKPLAEGGVEVINAGGFIHTAPNSEAAYQQLTQLLS